MPFLKEPFAIDPESMRVWELADKGPVPRTDGFRANFAFTHVDRPQAVCLAMTRACNLRCAYCFVRNDPALRTGTMTVETALKAIKLCDPDGAAISFFGGEPLLCFDAIRQIVREAEWVCNDPEFHVTTNATLMDSRKAEFFNQHDFSFVISVDGPPGIHDRYRPFAGERRKRRVSSYGRTIRGLEMLSRHGMAPRVTLRSTFTRDCVQIADRLAHLNELCDAGLGGHVAVEPVSSSESSCIDPLVAGELGFGLSDALGLQREYRSAFEWAAQRARSSSPVRWHQLNLFTERILSRTPAPSECGAGKGYIGVAPRGDVFACHRDAGRPIGHVDEGFDEAARACWIDNRLCARHSCPECWCRYICGGGCRADSIVHQGSIRSPYAVGCTITQAIIANTIRLLSRLTEPELRLVTRSAPA